MNWMDIFPFVARPFQKEFIETAIASLASSSAVISVAPNGFGKTIGAITAAIASGFPRIYYTSRTHKQLENVISTAKLINSKAGSTVINAMELMGRDRSCINDSPSILVGMDNVSIRCATFRKGLYCVTGKSPSTWLTIPSRGSMPSLPGTVVDGNDIIDAARSLNICPYYLSVAIHRNYRLVACSYNHVFDPIVRKSLNIDINGSLIICDECHNIIDALESFLTRELSTKMIASARRLPVKYSPGSIESLQRLDTMLSLSGQFFKEKNSTSVRLDEMMRFLAGHGFTMNWFGHASRCFKDDDDSGFLNGISSFLHVIKENSDARVHVSVSKPGSTKEISLKITSMNIQPLVDEIVASNARLMFMSGTISVPFFKGRIGIANAAVHDFSLPKRNLAVYIADTVPGLQKRLSSYYQERENTGIMNGFGEYLRHVLPAVRGGSIAFFPSYMFRESTRSAWEHDGYIDYDDDGHPVFIADGNTSIPLFVEKRDDKSKSAINDYKAATARGNALLLSIFRGGASEGEDFPRGQCRCIFCIGFPMRNVSSPDIKYKMEYYNAKKPGLGMYWLWWDTMSTVSQAIGRGIRDPVNDKAIAVLLDTRYNDSQYASLLSGWIHECIVLSGKNVTPKRVATDVARFFA